MKFIDRANEQLKILEKKEEYELCYRLKKIIDIISNRDKEMFLKSFFDSKSLIQCKFIQSEEQLENRIKSFFGLEDVFDYVEIADMDPILFINYV